MMGALIDHLWQSSLFAFAAAMLTLAFGKNGANIRFYMWLAASVKFLIPFPFLVMIGRNLRPETAPTIHAAPELFLVMDHLAQPGEMVTSSFPAPALTEAPTNWDGLIVVVWSIGFVALACRWLFQWVKIRAIVNAAIPLDIDTPIPVRVTLTILEPGIFGSFVPSS